MDVSVLMCLMLLRTRVEQAYATQCREHDIVLGRSDLRTDLGRNPESVGIGRISVAAPNCRRMSKMASHASAVAGIASLPRPGRIGGGIGHVRSYMYLVRKAHIGEVSVTAWSDELHRICEEPNIHVLR